MDRQRKFIQRLRRGEIRLSSDYIDYNISHDCKCILIKGNIDKLLEYCSKLDASVFDRSDAKQKYTIKTAHVYSFLLRHADDDIESGQEYILEEYIKNISRISKDDISKFLHNTFSNVAAYDSGLLESNNDRLNNRFVYFRYTNKKGCYSLISIEENDNSLIPIMPELPKNQPQRDRKLFKNKRTLVKNQLARYVKYYSADFTSRGLLK